MSAVAPETVKGARMPYLEVSNNYFQMMSENGFQWDSSLPTQQYDPPMWPHTLDYRTPLTDECIVQGCPTKPFPGLWEFPLIDWTYLNDTLCGNVPDACAHYETEEEVYEWLSMHFIRHYNGNRAPFPLNLRAAWFEADLTDFGGAGGRAMSRFLDDLEANDDVYFVTMSQAMEWMKNPTQLANINSFAPWKWCESAQQSTRAQPCTITAATEMCRYNVSLPYWGEPQEVNFFTCAESGCPPEWPSPDNPTGDEI